ncbi:MAG: GntT/GntP/DsdX family permease, partial [Planctomycetota bacterium]
GFHPLYLALVIGCGSKPIAWMNDSGFWLICKMTGMTEGETLRLSSAMMVVMAVVGLVVIMIFARLLPLV